MFFFNEEMRRGVFIFGEMKVIEVFVVWNLGGSWAVVRIGFFLSSSDNNKRLY